MMADYPWSALPLSSGRWLRLVAGVLAWWGSTGTPFTAGAQVQPAAPYFGHLSRAEGLPADEVRCLLLDRTGFLWIGTTDGLARFDGRTTRVFRRRRGDAQSLPHNFVLTLAEDPTGNLWIGTHGGVARLDRTRESFRTWHHNPADPTSIAADYDCRVWVSRTGSVWLGNGGGLSRYEPARDQWQPVPLPGDDRPTPTDHLLTAFVEDRAGRLWLGSTGRVRVFEPRTGRVVADWPLPTGPGESASPLLGLTEDPTGRVWASTWGTGLLAMPAVGESADRIVWNGRPGRHGTDNIALAALALRAPDGTSQLWTDLDGRLRTLALPAAGAGVHRADLLALAEVAPAGTSASPTDIRALCADSSAGRLWIGTAHGLFWLNPDWRPFAVLPLDTIGRPFVNRSVSRLRADRDPRTGARQYWLTSWYGDGLLLLDSALRRVRAWPRLPIGSPETDAGQMGDVVRSRVDGALWVATFNGLVRFDPATGATRTFGAALADSTRLPDRRCVTLLEDRAGRLWVGTYAHGVACLNTAADRRAGHFRRLPADAPGRPGLPNGQITALTEDRAGRIWIGTSGGLTRVDAAPGGGIHTYRAAPGRAHALPDDRISAIGEAPDGRVWIGTTDGLAVWRPRTDDFALLNSEHGLPADAITGLHVAPDGTLWLATARGLARVPPARNGSGPHAGPFRLFDTADGLPATGLAGLCEALPDGRLALGFPGQVVLADLYALRPRRQPPGVVITDVRLFNRPLPYDPATSARQVRGLAPEENTLTFSFAALDFADPRDARCGYRLETIGGPPRPWLLAEGARTVTFAQLDGGEYRFRVRAWSADGVPSVGSAVFRFRIRTPFWRTGWFWVSVGAGVLLVAGLVLRRRQQAAAKQAAIGREMAELELRALRAQLNPHFLFNALNAVQELVLTGRPLDAGRYLARFARLLRLVLENAERPVIPFETELDSLRLYASIEELRLPGLEIVFEIDPELLDAAPAVPPMVLQPYLENACWHGVAARPPDQRRVRVSLTFGPTDDTVRALIEDTGIGRGTTRQPPRPDAPDGGRTSQGQRLTARRLTLLGQAAGAALPPVHFTDLTDPTTGAPLGTRVEVWLPVVWRHG